jgi:hypothetical protein
MKYIEITMVISLFCLGLRAVTDKGKIGYPLRLLGEKIPLNLGKPLITCCTCMASVWGTIIYWSFYHNSYKEWILVTISASFFNSILWGMNLLIVKLIKKTQ